RSPARDAATALAAAHVVLPTPPLPPKNRNCGWRLGACRWWRGRRRFDLDLMFVDFVGNRGFDAGDLRPRGHGKGAGLRSFDFADAREHVAFELGEFLFGDLAEL